MLRVLLSICWIMKQLSDQSRWISSDFSRFGLRPRGLSIRRYSARFRRIIVKYSLIFKTACVAKKIWRIIKTIASIWGEIFNNYSPKWRWLAVDTPTLGWKVVLVYTKTVRQYTPQKLNLDDFFTCHGRKPGRHFLLSCSEVNRTGYSEFDEPISARV